jgi:BatD DUF11 like domain
MKIFKRTNYWFIAIFSLLTIPLPLSEKSIIVTSEANQYAKEGEQVLVSVTITHESSKKVDPNSFKMNDKPLKVEFAREVKFSERSDLILSIYHFLLPPQKKGLQILPPISVKVDGREYTSNESSYQVS